MEAHDDEADFDSTTRGIMPEERVQRLHLLRHGEVVAMRERLVRGQLDVELSDRGHEQSLQLSSWFNEQVPKPDALWSSDLKRCRVLAEELARLSGVSLQIDPRLREQNMGDWQGRTWREISATDGAAVTAYWDDYVDARPTGGESLRELHQRVESWWREQCAAEPHGCIVVVTHVGVLRSFQCSLLGLPLHDALRFAPEVASHTSFLISEESAVQTSFGERPWTFGSGK